MNEGPGQFNCWLADREGGSTLQPKARTRRTTRQSLAKRRGSTGNCWHLEQAECAGNSSLDRAMRSQQRAIASRETSATSPQTCTWPALHRADSREWIGMSQRKSHAECQSSGMNFSCGFLALQAARNRLAPSPGDPCQNQWAPKSCRWVANVYCVLVEP